MHSQVVTCCSSPLYVMSNPSRSLGASDEHQRVGPDYFGYYSSEVVNLLSRGEDDLPSATQTSKLPQSTRGQSSGKSTTQQSDSSGSLYSNGEDGFSNFEKERLRSLLRQSVTDLSSEVNEMLDPVLAIRRLQSTLRGERHSLSHTTAVPDDDTVQVPYKRLKGDGGQLGPNMDLEKNDEEVNGDLRFLLENDYGEVEEIVKKHSDQLSGTLGYMEQQLELLLDAVASKCRPMTLFEKQQLQKLIQKLPPRNLDRVVEIIGQSRPVGKEPCDQIYVDLEKEDDITLWRLYYYVKAVEKAKTTSFSQDSN